jgi:uncharacterized RDD family membrane protein YckC
VSSIPPPPPPNIPPPPPPSSIPPPPPPNYGAPASGGYANFGARFGALLIDSVLGALFLIPAVVTVAIGPTTEKACRVDEDGFRDSTGAFVATCEDPTGGTIAAAVILGAVFGLGFMLYQAHRQGTRGSTIGKGAVNIKVIDANTGAYIGFGRSIGRSLFAQFISSNVCLLGYLWAIWDKRNQTWHDKVVNSVVIRA